VETRQVVLFELENNVFGIPLENVQEVIKTPAITGIPNTSQFFKGVINLRDAVIPVLGLGEKLGLRESANGDRRTIIVNVSDNTAGVVVDHVSAVLKLDERSIVTSVSLCDMAGGAVSGIARVDEKLVVLLNLEQLLASDEVFNFKAIAEAIEAGLDGNS
jgi:purine-binding chemotaxis protein CheW